MLKYLDARGSYSSPLDDANLTTKKSLSKDDKIVLSGGGLS